MFKNIVTITRKELSAYFNSPIAYIFIAVFLIVANWLFFQNFFLFNQAQTRSYFDLLPWIFLFLAPAITMRLWAEEKSNGTIEIMFTLPVNDWEIILAKFFASLIFIAVVLAASLSVPISVGRIGSVDWGVVFGGYFGAFLMGGAYIALGLFISSLTKNQIVAFVLSLAALFILFIIGTPFVLGSFTGLWAKVLGIIGLGSHFYNISKGVIDTRDLFYYLSFIVFFLYLNFVSLQARNWK